MNQTRETFQFSAKILLKAARANRRRGFSLVEVVVAFGLVVFVLVTLLGLLPIGVTSNQVSAGETRATNILTAAEADLRNSYNPNGTSLIFNLEAPYVPGTSSVSTVSPKLVFNNPKANTLYTTGLNDLEVPVTPSPGVSYQISVIYTSVPASGSLAPMQARLVVSWPCLANAALTDVTSPGKVSDFVEAYVTFPAP